MPSLKHPLPDHLYWLTEKVQDLVKPGAFLLTDDKRVAPVGSTFTAGRPDVPMGAAWGDLAHSGYWDQSPYDGESFYLQLNLADIPCEVRQPDWPEHGMVWVTLDLSDSWQGHAYFDPRPAHQIPWRGRPAGKAPPRASRFELCDTLTMCTDFSLPEISWDYHKSGGMAADYDEWWSEHYGGRARSDVQVGGWMHPIQGDTDMQRKTLVLSMEQQSFGDCGALYLHYQRDRGFYVHAQTC